MDEHKKTLNSKIFVLLNIYTLITGFSVYSYCYFNEKATKTSKGLSINRILFSHYQVYN